MLSFLLSVFVMIFAVILSNLLNCHHFFLYFVLIPNPIQPHPKVYLHNIPQAEPFKTEMAQVRQKIGRTNCIQ